MEPSSPRNEITMPHSMTGIILKLLPSICTGNDTWVKRREGYTGCQLPSRTLETPLSCDLWTWTATLASKSHISMPHIGKWLQGRLIKTSERPARMWARSHWQRLSSHWQFRGEETLKCEEFNPRPEKLVAGMFLSQRTNLPQTHPPLQHFARIYSPHNTHRNFLLPEYTTMYRHTGAFSFQSSPLTLTMIRPNLRRWGRRGFPTCTRWIHCHTTPTSNICPLHELDDCMAPHAKYSKRCPRHQIAKNRLQKTKNLKNKMEIAESLSISTSAKITENVLEWEMEKTWTVLSPEKAEPGVKDPGPTNWFTFHPSVDSGKEKKRISPSTVCHSDCSSCYSCDLSHSPAIAPLCRSATQNLGTFHRRMAETWFFPVASHRPIKRRWFQQHRPWVLRCNQM